MELSQKQMFLLQKNQIIFQTKVHHNFMVRLERRETKYFYQISQILFVCERTGIALVVIVSSEYYQPVSLLSPIQKLM